MGGRLQSALAPAGPGAEAVHGIWTLFLWVSVAVYLAVVVALAAGLLRRRRAAPNAPDRQPDGAVERRLGAVVLGAVAATVAILAVLVVVSYAGVPALYAANDRAALEIDVTGHTWWWEVRYPAGPDGAAVAVTANEIHVPAGRPVRFLLRSVDVIHSLWIPSLQGKMDLIPGQTNRLTLSAAAPGTWRGQCAEFCGLEHAAMALMVVAQPPDDFRRWLARQRRDAPAPVTERQRRGLAVLQDRCGACHRVAGTAAAGEVGPDLTHLAGRLTLGAGLLVNSRGNRGGWISDAPTQKPGVVMPPQRMPPDDLQALLDFLDQLQ